MTGRRGSATRRELASGRGAWQKLLGAAPPLLSRCPLLIVAGRWAEARALWARRAEAALGCGSCTEISRMSGRWRGRKGSRMRRGRSCARACPTARRPRPARPTSPPWTCTVLAARLALDAGDHALARQWLEAHERWLAWAGPEVRWGRADGRLAWAEYHRATWRTRRRRCGTRNRRWPRRPPRASPSCSWPATACCGELLRAAGRDDEARVQFATALALAEACGAPYERALTLLAGAALDAASGHAARAGAALHTVRAICAPLGASPALARAEVLAATVACNRRRA